MMPFSIINALYESEEIPWQPLASKNVEYTAIRKKIIEEWQYFTEKIDPGDKDRFDKLSGLYTQEKDYERIEGYTRGFLAGALLMMEVIAQKERIEKWTQEPT